MDVFKVLIPDDEAHLPHHQVRLPHGQVNLPHGEVQGESAKALWLLACSNLSTGLNLLLTSF